MLAAFHELEQDSTYRSHGFKVGRGFILKVVRVLDLAWRPYTLVCGVVNVRCNPLALVERVLLHGRRPGTTAGRFFAFGVRHLRRNPVPILFVKPEDWDEDQPFEIVDREAEKPGDWLEDEPSTIPDPEAEKPEDWDDEEDGDWIPPQVPNPKCEESSGCGPWSPPMKKNPLYKGKWIAPYIENPAYKGVWAPRKIKNPNYFEDKTPANFEPMGAVCRILLEFVESS